MHIKWGRMQPIYNHIHSTAGLPSPAPFPFPFPFPNKQIRSTFFHPLIYHSPSPLSFPNSPSAGTWQSPSNEFSLTYCDSLFNICCARTILFLLFNRIRRRFTNKRAYLNNQKIVSAFPYAPLFHTNFGCFSYRMLEQAKKQEEDIQSVEERG